MSTRTRWDVLIVLAVFTQLLISTGPVYNYNVFFVHLQKEFKATAVATGWVGSLSATLFCAASPLAGAVGSKLGSLRVVLLGNVLSSAGYLFTSFIPALPYGFLTFGVVAGLGTSFACAASFSALLARFSGQTRSKCRVIGLSTTGSSVGVMVFGPLLNTLSAAYGWRNCLRITSGITLVLGVAGALPFLKSPGDRDSVEQGPSSGDGGDDKASSAAPKGTAEDDEDEPTAASRKGKCCQGLWCPSQALVDADAWLWVAATTLSQLGWSFVIINFSSFMDEIELSVGKRSAVLATSGAAEVVAKVLFAIVGDRLPFATLYLAAFSAAGGAITSGFLTLSSELAHMIILSIAWGLCRGLLYGPSLAACIELFPVYGPRTVSSITLIGYGLGVLIGAPITGALHDLTGDYTLSLLVLVGSFLMSLVCVLLIPARRRLQSTGTSRRHGDANADSATVDREEEVLPKVRHVGTSNPAFELDSLGWP